MQKVLYLSPGQLSAVQMRMMTFILFLFDFGFHKGTLTTHVSAPYLPATLDPTREQEPRAAFTADAAWL